MAVALGHVHMVRILDEAGADARIKNVDDISAIDVSVTEEIRDVKLHFMQQKKYQGYKFN